MRFLFIFTIISCTYSTTYCQSLLRCGYQTPDSVIITSNQKINSVQSTQAITIPVVVHIIYNTSQQNLGDSQILSQINVMNEDFRKMLNTPGYNTNSVGADTKYEFRMANRDPNGNATNGITRHYSSQTLFDFDKSSDIQTLQNFSYWNTDKYFNIWVVPKIIYFPYELIGLSRNVWDHNKLNGIIVNYKYFGDKVGTALDSGGNYNAGRTVTHETGHYLGLEHTFYPEGSCDNNNCSNDGDRVCDTPPVEYSTDGCPTSANSCPTDNPDLNDMIENFMDYTYDDCMNIFTQGQDERMDYFYNIYYYTLESSSGLTSNDFILFSEHIGDYDYNVTTNIVSKSDGPYSDLILRNGSSANLRAKGEIRLQDGFHSENGSELRAYIDDQLPPFPKTIKQDQEFDYTLTGGNKLLFISPNPVTSISDISLTVGAADNVSLMLYDNLGNKRLSYLEGVSLKPGTYNYILDGNELNSGMFLLVLNIDGKIITEKIINLK